MATTRGRGRIEEFDEARGIGIIDGGDGARLAFHCTRIADGSRTVRVGAEVRYEVVPGVLGWEAAAIDPA